MAEGAKKGTKITAEEAAKLNPAEMGVAITGTPDVEGQEAYLGLIECPWCGNVGRAILDTDRYKWFQCGGCGRAFRA